MADEESAPTTEETTTEEKPKSKKNLIIIVGAFVLLFILSSAGNYIHLKMTYVPPEPEVIEEPVVHVEEKHPVMSIHLGEDGDDGLGEIVTQHGVSYEEHTEVVVDSLGLAFEDSVQAVEDSIAILIQGLHASVREGDSLLSKTIKELERTKRQLKAQVAEEDSTNLRRSVKLAKIIESMPPKEAAKMLEPLEDLMVLDILMRLKQRQAAKIMAEFSAKRSARLSEVILKPLIRG